MVFCNIDYAHLIEIKVKRTRILISYVAYWQHLDMAWPQQPPIKGVETPKIWQDIIEVRTEVMVERFFIFIF
jgi:hypothetical protein